jgi:hypothetical protein
MARNRVIYQSEALYVGKNINSSETGEHRQLTRIQSANYSFDITRQDINQYGQLARIDALVIESPTVSLDFTYYPTDGFNERALGFYVNTGSSEGNFASGQMGNSSGQNFYIVTTKEGSDLNFDLQTEFTGKFGATNATGYIPALSGKGVIGIGNAFLTNYSLEAGVGAIPTVSVSVEGLNLNSSSYLYQSGTATGVSNGLFLFSGQVEGVATPLIDPSNGVAVTGVSVKLPTPQESTGAGWITALRPGDIVLNFDAYGAGAGLDSKAVPMSNISGNVNGIASEGLHLQTATLTLPLARTPINRLGTRFAFARVVDFPILATLNVNAILNEVESRNLANMLDDSTERDITIRIKNPTDGSKNALIYTLKGSRMTSESFTSSIGSNKTVDLTFETQIGGPTDTKHGIFVSGAGVQDPTVNGWGY